MKTLLLDIETAPNLAWVWGMHQQNVSPGQLEKPKEVLCFAAEWLESPYQPVFVSQWKDGTQGMAETAYRLLSEADAVITYNGDRFDIPHLEALMFVANTGEPEPYKSIDLYKTMKRFDLPFRKLGYVTELLGLESKLETGGFQLWRDVMLGDRTARATMKRYNQNDTKIMRDLYYRLLPWIKGHPNRNLYDPKVDGCPRCPAEAEALTKQGFRPTLTGMYQRYQCSQCGAWSSEGTRSYGASIR